MPTPTARAHDLIAQADYGGPLTAVVGRDNMVGHSFTRRRASGSDLLFDCKFPEVDAVILFPAIDLKEGLAVRLGARRYGACDHIPPFTAAQARAFEQQGFEHPHVVDLDGAFAGKPMNAAAVDRILETVSVPVQLGGGVRDTATVRLAQ